MATDKLPLKKRIASFFHLLYSLKAACIIFIISLILGFIYLRISYRSVHNAFLDADTLSFSSSVEGQIIEKFFEKGEKVRKGQVLFQLDNEIINEKINVKKAEIDLATETLKLQKIEIDEIMNQYISAKKNTDPLLRNIDENIKRLERSQAKASIMEKEIDLLQSELVLLECKNKKTTITSPGDGIILKSDKKEGDTIHEFEQLALISDIENIWVQANFKESELEELKLNDPVAISLSSYPYLQFYGNILSIEPDEKKEEYVVKVSVYQNISQEFPEKAVLRPNMKATLNFNTK